jgi:hypothetical protein
MNKEPTATRNGYNKTKPYDEGRGRRHQNSEPAHDKRRRDGRMLTCCGSGDAGWSSTIVENARGLGATTKGQRRRTLGGGIEVGLSGYGLQLYERPNSGRKRRSRCRTGDRTREDGRGGL